MSAEKTLLSLDKVEDQVALELPARDFMAWWDNLNIVVAPTIVVNAGANVGIQICTLSICQFNQYA